MKGKKYYKKIIAKAFARGLLYTTLAGASIIGACISNTNRDNSKDIEQREDLNSEISKYKTWKRALNGINYFEWQGAIKNYEEGLNAPLKKAIPLKRVIEYYEPQFNINGLENVLEEANYVGPTGFAGEIKDNDKTRVIEKEGDLVRIAEGIASWYSEDDGWKTASGVSFKDTKHYVAVNEKLGYELPCYVRITNLGNRKSDYAIAVDYGPYKFDRNGKAVKVGKVYDPHDERIIDVSPRIAKRLDFYKKGLANVRVEYLGAVELEKESNKL